MELVSDAVAELVVDRDHVLVVHGVIRHDAADLRLGLREPLEHRDLDVQPQPVAPMRPGDRGDVLEGPLIDRRIHLDLGEGRHRARRVMDGSHLIPAVALRDPTGLGGAQPLWIPLIRLDVFSRGASAMAVISEQTPSIRSSGVGPDQRRSVYPAASARSLGNRPPGAGPTSSTRRASRMVGRAPIAGANAAPGASTRVTDISSARPAFSACLTAWATSAVPTPWRRAASATMGSPNAMPLFSRSGSSRR